MADRYVNDHDNGSQLVLLNQLHVYECLWGESRDPWYVKDTEGRFIFANRTYLRLLGLIDTDTHYSVIGLTESDLLVRGGNHVSYEVLNASQQPGPRAPVYRTSFFCKFTNTKKEEVFYFLFDSMPVRDADGSVIGYSFHGKCDFIMTIPMLCDVTSHLPLPVTFTSSINTFSTRELDVIFLLLLGYTSLKISRYLGVSKRTAETYIYNVYSKAGAKGYFEFISYCYRSGFVNFITKNFQVL